MRERIQRKSLTAWLTGIRRRRRICHSILGCCWLCKMEKNGSAGIARGVELVAYANYYRLQHACHLSEWLSGGSREFSRIAQPHFRYSKKDKEVQLFVQGRKRERERTWCAMSRGEKGLKIKKYSSSAPTHRERALLSSRAISHW